MRTVIKPGRILLSLHPQYWDMYMSGAKIWELRKYTNAPCITVDSMVIYATAPVSRIVGEVNIVSRHGAYLDELWKTVESGVCITRTQYDRYYAGHRMGLAFRLGDVWEYTPKLPCYIPPQSWRYMDDDEYHQTCSIVRRHMVHPAT